MARQSKYTQKLADEVCERLVAGESLRAIVLDEHMPDERTVYRWLESNDAFRQQYARARELQADALLEDIIEIADDATNDWMERRGENSEGWVLNGEHVQRSKLRVDTRKWAMSKLAPKKYGDKVDLNHGGDVGVSVMFKTVYETDGD